MIVLATFMPEILDEVPDLPEIQIENYIRNATIEFAKKSKVLRREWTFNTQDCVEDYLIPLCEDERIHLITHVEFCNKSYPVSNVLGTVGKCGICSINDAEITLVHPNEINIKPAPRVASKMTVKAIVVPTLSACQVDEILFDRYKEGIVHYALSYLLLKNGANKNPAAADFHKRMAMQVETAAFYEQSRGYVAPTSQARRFV